MAASLGISVATELKDYKKITHFVTPSDPSFELRRTPKVMADLSRAASFVNFDWLQQSMEHSYCLPVDDFLVKGNKFSKEKYGFSLHQSFVNGALAINESKSNLSPFPPILTKAFIMNKYCPS